MQITAKHLTNRTCNTPKVWRIWKWFKIKEILVPYELKVQIIERFLLHVKYCFNSKDWKTFPLYRSWWYKIIILRCFQGRKSWCRPGQFSISRVKVHIHPLKVMICVLCFQMRVVYCEFIRPGQTITRERYQKHFEQLNCELKEKRLEYTERFDDF